MDRQTSIAAYSSREIYSVVKDGYLKCTGGNGVVSKERIDLRCNHDAIEVADFNVCNVDVYPHNIGATASQRVVEHNRPTQFNMLTVTFNVKIP